MGAEGNRSTAVNLHGSDAFEQRRAWAFSTIEAGAKERWWTRNKLELGDGDETPAVAGQGLQPNIATRIDISAL
jgi:hypothetical protein